MQRSFRYNIISGRQYEINDKFLSFVEEASEHVLRNGKTEADQEALENAFTYQLSDSPDNREAIALIEYGEAKPRSLSWDEEDNGTACGLKIKDKDVFLSDIAYAMENRQVAQLVQQALPELTLEEIEAAQRVLVGLTNGLECGTHPVSLKKRRAYAPAFPVRAANSGDLPRIASVVQDTIDAVYPHYYPQGVVQYFKEHHSSDKIAADIAEGCVYAAACEGALVGTVTVKENRIDRLFVLPACQGKGIGGALLDFAERSMIGRCSGVATLAASLPAKEFYFRHGYRETGFHRIETPVGDTLCYDTMEKLIYQSIRWWEL